MHRIKFIKMMTMFLILVIGMMLLENHDSKALMSNTVPQTKTIVLKKNAALGNSQQNEVKETMTEKQVTAAQIKEKQEAEQKNDNNRQLLEKEIRDYLGDKIDHIGLSYYDINSGKSIIINGDDTFLAGSTVKVQMNMVLGDMIKSGQISQDEALQYTEDCYEEGTGVLQGTDLSKPLSINLLSEYSITHSDNIATNMLIKRIGYDNMRDSIDTKIGHTTDHSGNYITANDETKLLKLLYNNIDNNSFYNQVIENMKKTDFHDRIDLYIPENLVAHKIGDYDNYVNDVGIIYTNKPFILSIYTNELPNANEVIAHISKMIYDYQNNII